VKKPVGSGCARPKLPGANWLAIATGAIPLRKPAPLAAEPRTFTHAFDVIPDSEQTAKRSAKPAPSVGVRADPFAVETTTSCCGVVHSMEALAVSRSAQYHQHA